MKYIIIGLGNYGGGLAEELMAIGHGSHRCRSERKGRVDNLKDKITTAFVLMQRMNWLWKLCHSERSMWWIVAIGENFGALYGWSLCETKESEAYLCPGYRFGA